jgi:hypothetical protein
MFDDDGDDDDDDDDDDDTNDNDNDDDDDDNNDNDDSEHSHKNDNDHMPSLFYSFKMLHQTCVHKGTKSISKVSKVSNLFASIPGGPQAISV